MPCCLTGTEPLPEPMLILQLHTQEHISMGLCKKDAMELHVTCTNQLI